MVPTALRTGSPAHGEVLGYACTAGNVLHGVLWKRGKAIDLLVAPGKDRTIAARITRAR